MVTMNEVAARAGVSQATVSFVLGGRADRLKISRQTRDRVLGAARDLGYQRNQLARAMVTGKSRIIGVLTAPHSGENIVRMLTGAMEAASQNNYLLKVVHLSYGGVDEATIARCLEWRLAGAIVVGLGEEAHQRLNVVFQENQIPVALVDNVPPLNWGVRVGSDDAKGIGEVVVHLLGLGHRRIALIGGRPGPLSKWREKSFRDALAAAGLEVPAHWVRLSSWSDQAIIEAEVRALFEESGDHLPTAVVCTADAVAMVVLRIARARGLRLPSDLSVTGYSNANLAEFVDPPLTTVDQSFQEMGRTAALQVIELAERTDADLKLPLEGILLPARLIERGSTAPPPPE
ncbi:MAG: LacI family DNA-binding transcriptional regulator [Cytophagales bacterium]|nr:LacI family DNA-binding transcriptional regulator [Armatimonadota bacterium]